MKVTDNIYTGVSGLKPYKIKRLFYSAYFRSLWNAQLDISTKQYEYKIATHCFLIRLREPDIVTIVTWWWRKHGIKPDFYRLRHFTIPKSYHWTIETVKAEKKAENQRAKARREAKCSTE